MHQPIKQHVIDPEICIRCYTCEEMCPIDAITHDDNNVVVDASICDFCMACIGPCPTGSIDNWRVVKTPYTLEEQFEWLELPEQEVFADDPAGGAVEALEADIERLLAEAHAGGGGAAIAPATASKPTVNIATRASPVKAVVQGNYRLTAESAGNDVRHIILDLGSQTFPVLEGQSVGITPPGETVPRLYSISSPRDGERPNTNNLSLTVKREDQGKCSAYLCDLAKGDEVALTGPFGSTFLMPDDPTANIVMICTGTGSAPFRAFTMRRQRVGGQAGRLVLFFGARTPEELPYFGPLSKVPEATLEQHLVFSRLTDQPKEYVQDRMRSEAASLAPLLNDKNTYIYVCGLKGMEPGVDDALAFAAGEAGLDWAALRGTMRSEGRYHVETY